jgi:hypothetical protein
VPLSTLPTLPLTTLTAVTGADGRYAAATAPLRPYLSEYALIKHRVLVEVEWLRVLARAGTAELPALDADSDAVLRDIVARFDGAGAARVKAIEATTNHDVKAVEYFLKEAVAASGNARLRAAAEFLHFAATSGASGAMDVTLKGHTPACPAGQALFVVAVLRAIARKASAGAASAAAVVG